MLITLTDMNGARRGGLVSKTASPSAYNAMSCFIKPLGDDTTLATSLWRLNNKEG